MSDDDERLLRELGRFVRASERSDEAARLERLCRDELSSEERALLEAAAARDPAAAERVRAHQPLSPAERAQIAAGVLATLRAGPRTSSDAPEPRGPRARWLAAPLAAAAASLLWFAASRGPSRSLPAYTLEISGAPAQLRGAEREPAPRDPVRLAPNTRLTLVLRPASEVRAEVSAVVFLVRADGELILWPSELTKAESGALRVSLAPVPVPLTEATAARVLVGAADLLRADAPSLARTEPERGRGFQRFALALAPAQQDAPDAR